MQKTSRLSPEIRERAVRMMQEHLRPTAEAPLIKELERRFKP